MRYINNDIFPIIKIIHVKFTKSVYSPIHSFSIFFFREGRDPRFFVLEKRTFQLYFVLFQVFSDILRLGFYVQVGERVGVEVIGGYVFTEFFLLEYAVFVDSVQLGGQVFGGHQGSQKGGYYYYGFYVILFVFGYQSLFLQVFVVLIYFLVDSFSSSLGLQTTQGGQMGIEVQFHFFIFIWFSVGSFSVSYSE